MMKTAATTACLVGFMCLSGTASYAKDCKPVLKEAGEASLTRLIAYPASLVAWRKAARDKYGETYESWRHAEKRDVACNATGSGLSKKWVCTRTAQPCTGDSAKTITAERLQRGDKGDQVSALQQILNDHGYKVTVDGSFGSGTERAVRDFQSKQGLPADGVVGKATREALLG